MADHKPESPDSHRVTASTEPADEHERDRPWLRDAAAEGGRAVVEKYGPEHMARIGRSGSSAVLRKYGLRFYSEIAARNRGRRKARPDDSGS